jgi:hypothetical protein
MADMLATKSTIQQAVVEGANPKEARAWIRYKTYLYSIGWRYDIFFKSFTTAEQHCIFAAFAHAIREGQFSSKIHSALKTESVHATLDCMAQTFELADKPNPRFDRENKFAFILQCQLRSYSNKDKPTVPQVAITGSIL